MNTKTFSQDDPALRLIYPAFVFRSLCSDGHMADKLLHATGLTEEDLADPSFRCGFSPLRKLLHNAIQVSGDPHLGIRLARKFEPTYIGLPAYAAMNAPRFQDALDILSRFLFLAFPAMEFRFQDGHIEPNSSNVAIRLRPKFPFTGIEYFAQISALVACDGLLSAILRSDRVALHAESTINEPDGWASVAHEIGFPIRFGAPEDRLFFPAKHLQQALPAHDPINHAVLVALCEKFARQAALQSTAVSQVLTYLEQKRSMSATSSEVAAALGYSERGLRRQLEQNGTSFRKLLEQARTVHAREMLAATPLSIKTIAFELGFDTPSNFARSFKRWTGTTPKAYRDRRKLRSEAGQN